MPLLRTSRGLYDVVQDALGLRKWYQSDLDGHGILKYAVAQLSERGLFKTRRTSTTIFLIVGMQSVDYTITAWHWGDDDGKPSSAIELHVALDTQSLVHAISIKTAEVTDRNGTPETVEYKRPGFAPVTNAAHSILPSPYHNVGSLNDD